MQEIRKEIKKIEYITQYEAIDGTIFDSAAECEKYEKSAESVLLARYKPLIVTRRSEESLFGVGSCEYEIDVIKLTEEDLDTVLQLIALFNSHYNSDKIQECRVILNKAIEDDDFIFIGRGYEYDHYDSFYIIDTLTDFINNIVKRCDPLTRVILEDEEVVE
jgi:hypothetical protein